MINFLKKMLAALVLCNGFITSAVLAETGAANPLLYSVAWKQTAAEYEALYYQGFNIARMRVELALARHKEGDKPIAIVSDFDDTLVLPLDYWAKLVSKDLDFFNDQLWDKWIPENKMVPSPGALEFLNFCKENNVEIFYVTSRDQGQKTYEYALGNLQSLGFPLKDKSRLTVLQDTSNKEIRQNEIMNDYEVAVFLGDNLNDFRRKYYLKGDVEGRKTKMREDRALYGSQYILFPNPTDGHWMASVFGESEPEASEETRKLLKKAAQGEP